MKILVVGATGATGRLLVQQLLDLGHEVIAVVRAAEKLPRSIRNHNHLSFIHASILDLSDLELAEHVSDCEAVACCLGHNLNFKGVFGRPRRLVTDATRRLCDAIKTNKPEKAIKYVLMNTVGNSNRDLDELVSLGQKLVIGLVRILLPPHSDNEKAADYLRTEIRQQDPAIEWAVVRPDKLIDEDQVSEYEVHVSPIRSAIFDSGETSRINVGHLMAKLITDDETWKHWKGQMPVIYNKT